MSTKFEQLIEFIINDDEAKARELFHSIVVEKSREIYESLDAEMQETDVSDDEVGGFIDEVEAESMSPVAEEGGFEDEMPADGMGDDMGDEMPADDMGMGDEMPADDMGMGGEEGEFGAEGDIEDRVVDLEDALDELKAEFDALVGEEGAGDEVAGDDEGSDDFGSDDEVAGDDEGSDDFGSDESDDEGSEDDEPTSESMVREYTEKAPKPVESEEGGVNKKSPIIGGKNDMGGTNANIVKGGSQEGKGNPTPSSKPWGFNDPKAAAKGAFKSNAPKAKTGEEGSVNKKSTI
jgi:hypothetical protein